jgi:O-antigen/teichoic acid export membrane protein
MPLLKLLRLRPFDTSTPLGRADERGRRAALTALAATVAKVISMAAQLISVPLTLHYLGVERYGMWMTISSFMSVLAFADFGIGNGVLNAVSRAYGKDDVEQIRRYVSSGLLILSTIAMAVLLLFAVAYDFVPWFKLFNVSTDLARRDSGPALAAFVLCFAIAIPTGLIQNAQLGLQRGFMANLWQCLGSVLGLAALLVAIHERAGVAVLVLALVGTPLLANVANGIVFFGWLSPEISPRWKMVSKQAIGPITHIGFMFFLMQIETAIFFVSDNIVIAQLLGASAVTIYAVPQRMFNLIAIGLTVAMGPLWPAYGEAVSRGDHAWAISTLKKSLVAAVGLSLIVCPFLVIFGNWLIHVWVGPSVTAPLLLLIGLAAWQVAWQVAHAVNRAFSMYFNGINVIGFQLLIGGVTAVTAVLLKIYWVTRIGVAGVPLASAVCYFLFTGVPIYFYLRWRRPAA